MIFVSNCPALPTNGSPCSSSSAPGASPTNINGESMAPTPNTTFFRDAARCGHFWQTIAPARNSAMATCFVWRSSGAAPGEAGGADAALARGGTATVDSNKGNACKGGAGERLGTATDELDSRTHGETSAANVS